MKGKATMLSLVEDYLAFGHRLGFTLRTTGAELRLFGRYVDEIGHRGPLTIELAVRWAKLPTEAKPAYWAWRLYAVRMFAQHRALEDPQTEVPPPGLLGPMFRRGQPYIYSAQEIQALLKAGATLRRRMRPHTCVALFGLLASTGLRVGEALAQIVKPRPWAEKIVLADYNIVRAQEVQAKLEDPERFPAEFIDACQQAMIEELARKPQGRPDHERG